MTAPTIPSKPAPAPKTADNGNGVKNRPSPTAAGEKRDGWLVIVCVIAGVALLASFVGMGFGMRAIDESKTNSSNVVAPGSDSAAAAAPAMAEVSLKEFAITPKVITVATGGMLMVTNGGTMQHNLAIEGKDLRTPMLDANGNADLELGALPAGTYTVFCEVAGHRQAGMEAQLKVVAGGSGAAAPGA